jgi:hypothetical protein
MVPMAIPHGFDLDEFRDHSLEVVVVHHNGEPSGVPSQLFYVLVPNHILSSVFIIELFWVSLRYWIRASFRSLFIIPVSLK